jgi:hypothetical protein
MTEGSHWIQKCSRRCSRCRSFCLSKWKRLT